jgi:hypothetical protein
MKLPNGDQKQKKACCGGSVHWVCMITKVLIVVAIVLGVISCILAIGTKSRMYKYNAGSAGCSLANSGACPMALKRSAGNEFQNYERVAGVITKIEGAVITIVDNGLQEATVISTAETVIMNVKGEVGLSMLRPGQFISAVVTDNGSGKSVILINVSGE